MKVVSILFCLILVATAFTGCVNKEKLKSSLADPSVTASTEGTQAAASQSPDKVVIVSSTDALPLMLELTQGQPYEASCIGKEASVEAIHLKTAQLALYDGYIESEQGLQKVIGYESVALVVNNQSPLEDVNPEEVRAFFCGESEQIQGQTYERVVTSPSTPTRSLFEEFFQTKVDLNGMLKTLIPSTATLAESDSQVVEAVNKNPDAIGIILLGNLTDQVKTLKLSGVSPDHKSVIEGTYPVSKPLVLFADTSNEAVFQAFLDQVKSESGQKAMMKTGVLVSIEE